MKSGRKGGGGKLTQGRDEDGTNEGQNTRKLALSHGHKILLESLEQLLLLANGEPWLLVASREPCLLLATRKP
jgi:hypothetical protein